MADGDNPLTVANLKDETTDLFNRLTLNNEDINAHISKLKEIEVKNSELEKRIKAYEGRLSEIMEKNYKSDQENSLLKLEMRKTQLSINSPGKVLALITQMINSNMNNLNNRSSISSNKNNLTASIKDDDSKIDKLTKEKQELKEINDKLNSMLNEKEGELNKIKKINSEFNDKNKNTKIDLNAKINDCKSELTDLQNLIKQKDKEIEKMEEVDNIYNKYNLMNIEYEQYKENLAKEKEMFLFNKSNNEIIEKNNKELFENVTKMEESYNELKKKGSAKVNEMNDIKLYFLINENLRTQIGTVQDLGESLDKSYTELIKKNIQNYKTLEDKYLEACKELELIKKNVADNRQTDDAESTKLRNDYDILKSKVDAEERQMNDVVNKYGEVMDGYSQINKDFNELQETMTKLREKDDIEITLIEERYIVLENMLELEKNDLIKENRDLINKSNFLIRNYVAMNNTNNKDKGSDNQNNNQGTLTENGKKMLAELKNIQNANLNLMNKLKEQEKTIFELSSKCSCLTNLKDENKKLKNSLIDSTKNYHNVIEQLTNIANQLNEELLESRKRTSLLKSKSNYGKEEEAIKEDANNANNANNTNNKVVNAEKEGYIKEIQKLKQTNEEEINKLNDEITRLNAEFSSIRAAMADESFNKDNDIIKYKGLAKKYKDMCEAHGLIKK